MQFVDYTKIFVKSGDGGRGCVSFRREKFVPKGGPDGGDGGRGGHVVIRSSRELNTLLDCRYNREYKAQRGEHGKGSNKHGKDGSDIIIKVPVGTQIKDDLTGEVLADFDTEDMEYVAAEGGRGGLGNSHFATSTRQAPKFAQPGEEGQERWLVLELKLLADVGLIGLPNAGKSTLISVISAARPKIADYPFTTLVPNLGVAKINDQKSFVVADIPGLIEGAHSGTGLGFQFLRHVERNAVLLHLVDVSDMQPTDPVEDFEKINKELILYNAALESKPMAVAATKIDIAVQGERLKMLEKYCKTKGIKFCPVSAATGQGIKELLFHLSEMLDRSGG
ncbi:MAG: GTPase ObgE [Dissulfurispiraceae bacterium]|jgi:GTP-binding protein|nr:GTPase ObgE [Dissulfurispiraceae bacterium]